MSTGGGWRGAAGWTGKDDDSWGRLSYSNIVLQSLSQTSEAATDVTNAEISFPVATTSDDTFSLYVIPTDITTENGDAVVSSSQE